MSAAEKKCYIPLGLLVFIMIGDLPFALGFFGQEQSRSAIEYATGAIPLVLAVMMYRHSNVARFATVALCLFYAMIIGTDLPITRSATDYAFSPERLLGWTAVALLLWLAWLFSLSPSARAWFPKSQPAADMPPSSPL